MERIVEKILQKKFGKFFYGIDHKHIHLGLLAGEFTIEGIGLQPGVFNSLNLPIVLRYSFVEKMQVSYAWREEFSNLVINIENIYAIVTPKEQHQYKFVETLQRNKQELIKEVIKEFMNKEKEAEKKGKERSAFENIFIKMLDNIYLRIKHIHIRYEHALQRFSFGVTIHEILVETRDAQGRKYYFEREKCKEQYVNQVLEVNRLGVYWNSNESNLLAGMTAADITSHMYGLSVGGIYSDQNLLEPDVGIGRSGEPRLRYIININMFCSLKKYLTSEDLRNPEYECQVNFQEIEAKITHDQYSQIMQLVQSFLAYQAHWKTVQQANELQNYKLKSAREILNMMRAKKYAHQGDQSQYTTKYVRSYLTWVFRSIRERIIMKKFVSLVIQKPITYENIKAVPALRRIIHKIDGDKIKQWLQIALQFKADFEREIPKLKIDRNQYLNIKLEATLFHAYRNADRKSADQQFGLQEQETASSHSTDENQYIWFKLRVNIESGRCEISKGQFGLLCGWNGLHAELFLRKGNFYVQISMCDFSIKLFDSWGSGGRAYVDVLKKTSALEYNAQKKRLLTIQFEKNPISKPYVFTQIQLELRSIELTAFPSSLKKLYEILSEGVKKQPNQQQTERPKHENLKTERQLENDPAIKTTGFQRNCISAKIHSPWIIIPLSKVNDKKSECWVVRLGDFSINTPLESDVFLTMKGKDEELYYEFYEMELQNFELKYYSSIHFFYSCLKFGGSNRMTHLMSSELMENGSVLDVIKPFSSSLSIQFLKKMLSSSVKDSNFGLKCKLNIDSIDISLSSIVLTKLKSLWEELKKDENPQFLQNNKQDILQGSSLKGTLSVKYGKFTNMRFFGVLAGRQLYLFASQHSRSHQLQVNLQELQVRLIDTEHLATRVTLNPQNKEVLELYFETGSEMNRWKQHIERSSIGKDAPQPIKKEARSESKTLITGTEFKSRQSIMQPPMKKESKYTFKLTISQLKLSLYNEQKEFLSCRINNLGFSLIQFIRKSFDLLIHQLELTEPNHRVKVLLSSKLMTPNIRQSPKFLDMKISCDEVGAIRQVDLNFQDILIVWKIDVIQKVISFFFLESQNPAVPPPPQARKRIIEITANMQRMHLVFAHKQYLTGIIKIDDSRLIYKTTVNSETYEYVAGRLEVYNYQNSDITKEIPLFRARTSVERQRFQVLYSAGRAVEHSQSPLKRGGSESLLSETSYITASDLAMTISGYQIHYMHEQFMRMFNYMLNKFMGSISSKFKVKKQYSPEYIYETMRNKRNGSMRVELLECVGRILDTADSEEHLRMEIPRLVVHKNIDSNYAATVRMVDTKKGPMLLPYQKLVIEMSQMDLYYINERRHQRLKVNNLHPINLLMQYNKWNLQRDYFPVLRHIDDIDRTITMHIDLAEKMDFNLQKIVFYMIMKIYYRNMKHKDGLAEEYEPATPYATPREYKIRIPELILRLSEENDAMFRQFAAIQLPTFRVDVREVRTLINFNIRADQIFCRYEDPLAADTIVEVYKKNEQSVFKVDMQSDRGTINADIMLRNYKVSLDINQIDSLTDYFDFDANDVDNKRMPKKSTKSFQNFRITFKDGIAVVISGNDTLGLSGLVFVNLSKNPGSEWDEQLKKFLGEGVAKEDVNEKEIKVNAENVSVFMNATKVTELPNFLYTRNEFSARKVGRRHRREYILLQSMQLCFFMSYVKILQRMYKQRIKKIKVKKSYFDPAAGIKPKIKYDDKRTYSIEGQPLSVVMMHPHSNGCYPAAKLVVDLRKLIIGMRTSVVKQIAATFDLKVLNRGHNFSFVQILEAKNMSVTYDSDDGRKRVQVGENSLDFDTFNVNESIVNQLVKSKGESSKIAETSSVKLINDTDSQVGIELGFGSRVLLHQKLHRYETKVVSLSHYHYCRLYAEQAYVKIGLLQHSLEANVQLSGVDCKKLFILEDRYYLSVNQDDLLTVRIMSQFKLQNKTTLKFRYRLRENKNSSKSMSTMEPLSSQNVNFHAGSELVLFDEASQDQAVLTFHNKFEHRANYNFRLMVGSGCMSTLVLTPKVLLTNMLPMKLTLSHSKLHLQVEPFHTVEVHEHSFKAKREISLHLGESKFKCSTDIFLEKSHQGKPNLLQLAGPEGHLHYTLQLQVVEKDDSLHWILKPQIVLSNLTGGVLELVRHDKIFGLDPNCSVIGDREEPFVIRGAQQFKLHVNSLKYKQQVQSNDLVMVLVNLNHENIKVPTVLVYSEVTVINETKHVLALDDYRSLASQGTCSVILRKGDAISVGLGTAIKQLKFQNQEELHFYLNVPSKKSEPVRVLLKAEIVRLHKRKFIKIEQQPSPSHFWMKNNMKGFTLTVRQLNSDPHEHFIVPESSERGVSLEDPSLPDTIEIEFYYNLKNIDFNKKLVVVPKEQPKVATVVLDEQGVKFSIKFTFEKGKSSLTFTFDLAEGDAVEQPTVFELEVKRLLFNVRFSPKEYEHKTMCLLLEHLRGKMTKVGNSTSYQMLLGNLAAQYKKNHVLCKQQKERSFADVNLTIDKSFAFTNIVNANIILASFDINIHEEFLYETANFLKQFELLDIKKSPNSGKNGQVVQLLKTGDKSHLHEMHDLELAEGRKLRTKDDPRMFVTLLRLQPVTILLSYLKGDSFNVNQFRTHNILKYLTVIPNVKELRLPISELVLQNLDGTQKSFKKKLTSHIKKSIPSSVGSSISSLSVLENPVEAISTITGIVNGIWSIT